MSKSLPDLCIGLDGPQVRPIGIGTNAWGGVQAANSIPTNSTAVVKSALESGVRFFDTAEIYNRGRSERLLGEAIRYVADALQEELDVVVATKFAPLPYRVTTGSIVRALNGSRERIGLNRPLGLYQIHWPYTVLSTKTLMATLASAKRDGSILELQIEGKSKSVFIAPTRFPSQLSGKKRNQCTIPRKEIDAQQSSIIYYFTP